MKYLYLQLLCAGLVAVPFVTRAIAETRSKPSRPNIIFMLSDDQGWNGLSVRMHPDHAESGSDFYRTPSLEKLAAQGMRFSCAYAPASVCSPTRCSLQTGKSPARNRWTKAAKSVSAADGYKFITPRSNRNLAASETTIAELLQASGYATAHYGKWHIGGGGPGAHGYDEHDGDTGNEHAFKFNDPNPVDIFGMACRTEKFMEKNKKAKKPFFIQLSWHALHAPGNALKKTLEESRKRTPGRLHRDFERAAITENLDTGVGMVMEAIDRLGLAANTYVIYMSDNGSGGRKNGVLSGGKGSVREGGIRVPLIVRGPGIRSGSWCHTTVVGYDFFPTFCEWAKISRLPRGIEGGSIVSLLKKPTKVEVKRPRKDLVFHFPHYQSGEGPHTALISGNLKVIRFYETDQLRLFDLSKDIGERQDLSARMPAQAKALDARMKTYLAGVDADMPRLNPDHDPSKTPASQREAKRQRKQGGRKGEKARRPGKKRKEPRRPDLERESG